MAIYKPVRCPGCNKIGSARLNGYCKHCFPNNKKPEPEALPYRRETHFPSQFFQSEPFIPGEFRCLQKKPFEKEPGL